jgi:hypothetical protein
MATASRVYTSTIVKERNRLPSCGLTGTYISVEPFHLQAYVVEEVFRYNNRKNMNDQMRFEAAMKYVFGKRLTYAKLIGTGSAASH